MGTQGIAETLHGVLGWHLLELKGCDSAARPRVHWHRIHNLLLSYIQFGCPAEMTVDTDQRVLIIQRPMAGHARIRLGVEDLDLTPGRAVITCDTDRLMMRWSPDCRMSVLRMELDAVESRLMDVIRGPLREPFRIQPVMDVASGRGLSWLRWWTLLTEELDRPGALVEEQHEAVAFERQLMSTLLRVQPHNHTSYLIKGDEPGNVDRNGVALDAVSGYPLYLRKVLQIVDNNPEWEHTTSSLAQFAAISPRALQAQFKQHVGLSPKAYLTNVRLDRVYDALLAASRGEVTVGQVAVHYGFKHYGRFVTLYRQRYGERPYDTLLRTPRSR
ncbi:AraC family transcriptional regulator [Phytoactinopolyspora halotolerans]|uniref:AraC family transcriptional regulator n=1 Tax=Phytoactinopolyspora halotolerans TaxID=1981512 RepID=A0A6L9SHX5_9ACTN|nr:AraC family transcriptional regulator [Phytoactinopolyspora halotolerans]NEE03931.1 AraC family transcriptional regulator [Phytoactinopolyspora halotolerans]